MSGKRNYKIETLQKLLNTGISKDKDIMSLQIEDLVKINDLKIVDIKNIIELRERIKKDGLISYLSENKKEE